MPDHPPFLQATLEHAIHFALQVRRTYYLFQVKSEKTIGHLRNQEVTNGKMAQRKTEEKETGPGRKK
jgi:hypothetical protein